MHYIQPKSSKPTERIVQFQKEPLKKKTGAPTCKSPSKMPPPPDPSLAHPNLVSGQATQNMLKLSAPLIRVDPLRLAWDVSLATQHLHARRLAHCNLTPDCVWEQNGVFKVSGFESAVEMRSLSSEDDVRRVLSQLSADPQWKAPELFKLRVHSEIDCKIDVWNIGLLVSYYLFGYSKAKVQFIGDLSQKIKDLLQMTLISNPLQRANICQILDKIAEQKPAVPLRCSLKYTLKKLLNPKDSARELILSIYCKKEVSLEQVACRLASKAWRTPCEVSAFYEEALVLRGLECPDARLKLLTLVLHYLQSAPLRAYHSEPGLPEVVQYVEDYVSVRQGHPYKNEYFRAASKALLRVLTEKFEMTAAYDWLFNGNFYVNQSGLRRLHDFSEVLERLARYWELLILAHKLLAQHAPLEGTRRGARLSLIREQMHLAAIFREISNRPFESLHATAEPLCGLDGFSLDGPLKRPVSEWSPNLRECRFVCNLFSGRKNQVWKGVYRGKAVAVKQVRLLSQASISEFQRELNALKALRHPNIVKLLWGDSRPLPFIVTKYCRGGSLFELVHKSELSLSWAQRLKVLLDVSRGMEYLHANQFIHRDLKTPNLLLARPVLSSKDRVLVKIIDFGISRSCSEADLECGTEGTSFWMAPEVINGALCSFKADVYSFGIVTFEVITGRMPYEGLSAEEVRGRVVHEGLRPKLKHVKKGCSVEMIGLMKACWDRDPGRRPSFDDILVALEAIYESYTNE